MLRELYDDDVGLDELIAEERQIEDPLEARRVLIALAQVERERDVVKATRDAVKDAYDRKVGGLEERAAFLRRCLQGYVERHGNASFPDAGTAYLQAGKPRIEVADLDAVKRHHGAMFTREVFDEAGFKAWALEQATGGGEVPVGCNVVPGGPQLRVRRS